jgi:hypothetical protein
MSLQYMGKELGIGWNGFTKVTPRNTGFLCIDGLPFNYANSVTLVPNCQRFI